MEFPINWLKNRYVRAYGAAVLLHVLLFALQTPIKQAWMAPPAVPESEPEQPSLVYEFVDVPPSEQPNLRPEQTPLLSDADRLSRDRQDALLPEGHLAYSDGVSVSKEAFETVPGQRRSDVAEAQERASEGSEMASRQEQSQEAFDFSEVLHQDPLDVQRQREQAVLGRVSLPEMRVANQNLETRALERGGLQLSTYAWDYAPYMAYLKRHIQDHIFPPRLFDLGLIEGKTRVKFRIMRDGRLEGFEMLGFDGSPLLKSTSVKAVELSAPFRSLPTDFPDAYLEIIGTFEYIILRNAPR